MSRVDPKIPHLDPSERRGRARMGTRVGDSGKMAYRAVWTTHTLYCLVLGNRTGGTAPGFLKGASSDLAPPSPDWAQPPEQDAKGSALGQFLVSAPYPSGQVEGGGHGSFWNGGWECSLPMLRGLSPLLSTGIFLG